MTIFRLIIIIIIFFFINTQLHIHRDPVFFQSQIIIISRFSLSNNSISHFPIPASGLKYVQRFVTLLVII